MKAYRIITVLCLWLLAMASTSAAIYRITLDGPITPIEAEYIVSAMRQAEKANASLIVLEMNTPGGLGDSMKDIIQQILNSRVPVVGYVYPSGAHAASAGFFILMATDVAAMANGTNTGAAHPLLAIGGIMPLPEDEKMKPLLEKVQNDILAYLRGIVRQRGRNEAAAVAAVTESASYTAKEALSKGLINLIAPSEEDLLRQLNGMTIKQFDGTVKTLHTEGQQVKTIEMNFRQKVLTFISDPTLAVILALAGILGLFFEFSHPGFIFPGVIGGICLILALMGFSMLPINYVGVLLIILAIALFIAEIKVQGFGVLGIGGIISLALGFLILVDSPEPSMRIHPALIWGVVLPVGITLLLLTRLVIRAMRRPSATGKEGMTGERGIAYTDLAPTGTVFSHGEYWNAESESGETIPAGTPVIVTQGIGLRLIVKASAEKQASRE